MRRRGFLGATAAAAAAAGAGCKALERGYPEKYWPAQPPVVARGWAQGEERLIRSACLQCPGGCGIVVRVVEGRAVKIEGNPDFPTNQGGLCPKGLNGLQVLYDPDRVRGPLERIGARGAGRFRPIAWDQALARVAEHLASLRARGESHRLAVLGGRYKGHMRPLVRRFLEAYGSPNDLDHESIGGGGDRVAHLLSQGVRDHLAYDWERTRYVLSFGAGLVESFRPTAMMLRVFGHLRQGVPGQRAKIVQIDPRYGVTAAKADEWVQLRPGTDGALALGMAHVLLREGLCDRRFLADHVLGLDRFAALVERAYSPEVVADITGVPAATIERLAREAAAQRPTIAVAGRGAAAHTGGVYAVLAVHALNALLGSVDASGGVLVQRHPPFAEWPAPELDAAARAGLGRPRIDHDPAGALCGEGGVPVLAERLERGQPYQLGAVFLYYTNPLFSAPSPARLAAALDRVPLVVSFSPFLDESSARADLILPDHTYLERWQLDEPPASVGFPVFSVRRPVVEPVHDTRSTGEVLIALARGLGGAVARAFPWTELEMIQALVRGVHASGRGSVRGGSFDEFWTRLLEVGGWWEPGYRHGVWREVLRTPSGKLELYATALERCVDARGADRDAVLAAAGVAARGAEAFLPHHEPPHPLGAPGEGGFHLVTYKTMTHAEGRGGNQPHLQELFGVQFDRAWEPWVELHPADAHALGIVHGAAVRLHTPAGTVRLRAVLSDWMQRGVVHVPFEYGHTAWGRWASGRGDAVNPLVEPARDPVSGSVAWYDVRVRVERG